MSYTTSTNYNIRNCEHRNVSAHRFMQLTWDKHDFHTSTVNLTAYKKESNILEDCKYMHITYTDKAQCALVYVY